MRQKILIEACTQYFKGYFLFVFQGSMVFILEFIPHEIIFYGRQD